MTGGPMASQIGHLVALGGCKDASKASGMDPKFCGKRGLSGRLGGQFLNSIQR